jgi:hypothetical protein
MPRMKSRDRFPPGGWKWFQPENKFSVPANASFEAAVSAILANRQANPYLVQTHGWSTDPEAVRAQLDDYNARICEQMGWHDYIFGGPSPAVSPKTMPPPSSPDKARSVVAGGEALVEWIASGAQAVPNDVANRRASICSDCPQNGKGDFSRYFTIPVSEAIRKELSRRSEWELSTSFDDKLNVCEACLCPLKLKVHVPLANILPHMDAATRSRLDPRCWITKPE